MEENEIDNQIKPDIEITASGSNALAAALELQDALKDFRKAVNEAFDQRKSAFDQRRSLLSNTGQQHHEVPGLRNHALHNRDPAWQSSYRDPAWQSSIRDPAWLTSREAAALLRVCTQTLKRYRKKQIIPFARVGGCYRYRYEALVKYINNKKSYTTYND